MYHELITHMRLFLHDGSFVPESKEIQQVDPPISRPFGVSVSLIGNQQFGFFPGWIYTRNGVAWSAAVTPATTTTTDWGGGGGERLTATICSLRDDWRSTSLCTDPCTPSRPGRRPRPGSRSRPGRSRARRARGCTRSRTRSRP